MKISSGILIKLYTYPNTDENVTVTLSSSLVALGDNNRLIVSVSLPELITYPVNATQEVILECTENGAAMVSEATILQRIDRGPQSYLLLEQKSDFRLIQRRKDFRIDCLLYGHIEYRDSTTGSLEKRKITARNISGGGVCIQSPKDFDIGEHINVYLPLDNNGEFMRFRCEVRRCVQNKKTMQYNLGLQFAFEGSGQKDKLITRIFKMEREHRKLG